MKKPTARGDVAKDKAEGRHFLADYKLTIHFASDGTSSLKKSELQKYESF